MLRWAGRHGGSQNASRSETDLLILLGSVVLAGSLLGLAVLASYVLNVPISHLTRDPMAVAHGQFYFGFLSNVGVVAWSFSAAICLFSYWLLRLGGDRSDRMRAFVFFGGVISLVLLADDLFMPGNGYKPASSAFSRTQHRCGRFSERCHFRARARTQAAMLARNARPPRILRADRLHGSGAGIGHLEKFEVPARGKDAPPFSSAYALENEAKRKSHLSLRVSKNPRDGIFRGPL
jgi:hypothetical protein